MRLTTKWDRFGSSIFSVMTQRALAANAINLAQGYPDFDGPQAIKDAAIAAIKDGMNQYAPSAGLLEFRQLLGAEKTRATGLAYDPISEITVFSGATEAIFCALQALLEAGDEVIAFEPFYDSYGAAAHAAGAKLVGVQLKPPHWQFDPSSLRRAITSKTRMLLLNSPHNPTGRVFEQDELIEIRNLAVEHDLLVITDEVYEALVFAPHIHRSIATLPGMKERTVVVSSTSKTFSFTGWKVGYAFSPAKIMNLLRTVHQFTVFCSATPLQAGMIAALKLPATYYSDLNDHYRARRDELVALLNRTGFKCTAPQGTYFALADYSHHKDVDDFTFANWLTDTGKVAVVPISGFYCRPDDAARQLRFVRFAFCKSSETLQAAERNLTLL